MPRRNPGLRRLLAASLACIAAVPAWPSELHVLYRFTGGSDGTHPGGPLLIDAGGNLFGTAAGGGRGNGVAFELSPASPHWVLTVLHQFAPETKVGRVNPGLATDAKGALYGTTYASHGGLAFRLAPPRAQGGAWRFSRIATFAGPTSTLGAGASGALVVDAGGDVIGTTQSGGDQSGAIPCQCGVAYRLKATGGTRTEQILHTFKPRPDGNTPVAGLTSGGPGVLFGTTYQGGTGRCRDGSGVVLVGCGTVFELARSGANWTETTLYNFEISQGNAPTDPPVVGPDGALYGYANLDVYRLAQDANGSWDERTIYSFAGGITGTAPTGRPLFDAAGQLFGTTRSFGIDGPATVFRLTAGAAPNQPWTAKTLATVASSYKQPQPMGGLSRGADGTLYGAASSLAAGTGFVFAVTP